MLKNVFYHAWNAKEAQDLYNEIEEIKKTKINYDFLVKNKESVTPSNIILLIGESERKQNMSLYGYKRNTTPYEVHEKNNILIYENAHSPASITNLAVPIVLSNINMENYKRNIKQLSDNVLNVANHLGYQTYWYSTQGQANGITAISSFAKTRKWVDGFDEKLLPYLKESVSHNSEKKLIVLHINGSHPYCRDKYPKREEYWKNGIDDYYDNSVKYTDKIIGQIMKELKSTKSVLVYLSDHGQKRDTDKYRHGDYKEAVQVPFFIWYSDGLNSKNKGISVKKNINTCLLYDEILNLMGVTNPKSKYNENENKYLKLDLNTINYSELQ